jgi:ribosomal protein L39E
MTRNKPVAKKLRLIERGKKRPAPRWADIKKFGLKHARTRRIQSGRVRNWRRGNLEA